MFNETEFVFVLFSAKSHNISWKKNKQNQYLLRSVRKCVYHGLRGIHMPGTSHRSVLLPHYTKCYRAFRISGRFFGLHTLIVFH